MSPARPTLSWLLLVAASGAIALAADRAGVPGAFLVGPMLAAIGLGVAGRAVRVPRPAFAAAQAVIGCLVAHSVTPAFVRQFVENGAVMLAVVGVTVLASAGLGLALTRWRVLPGTTAAWGSSPGGAAAMVAMAEAHGSDPTLVAFMQYVRVALVVLSASLVTRLMAAPGAAAQALPAPASAGALAVTALVAVIGAGLGTALRLPAGAMIGPMMLGAAVHGAGLAEIAVPGIVLEAAFAVIGWYVGLRFTRETLRQVWHALPAVLAATILLILLCAGWALGLAHWLPVDFLTAFLATSPGGLDSIAVIAVGAHADVPFVLGIQTLRLFVVLLTGPMLARLIVRAAGAGDG